MHLVTSVQGFSEKLKRGGGGAEDTECLCVRACVRVCVCMLGLVEAG